jgi:hypothetical protein
MRLAKDESLRSLTHHEGLAAACATMSEIAAEEKYTTSDAKLRPKKFTRSSRPPIFAASCPLIGQPDAK